MDYFFGDPIHIHTEPDFDRQAWMAKSKKQANDAFPGWLEAVRETYGILQFCSILNIFNAEIKVQRTQSIVLLVCSNPSNSSFYVHFLQDIALVALLLWRLPQPIRLLPVRYSHLAQVYPIHKEFLAAFAHPAFLSEDHFRNITSETPSR